MAILYSQHALVGGGITLAGGLLAAAALGCLPGESVEFGLDSFPALFSVLAVRAVPLRVDKAVISIRPTEEPAEVPDRPGRNGSS